MEINYIGSDNLYAYDDKTLEQLRKQKGWMNDPKYFNRVVISPSAVVKMMAHGQSGVEKGISKGGNPIEVMGLLLGRPDTTDPRCMIVTDAQPLPIEGFETKVVADDESVLHYMIDLGDSNELSRKERFCGWYHTHPFDADNCLFLSSTDISTQLQWQRSEDPHGNPWLAIVIDPIKSVVKGKPELAAFRVYPPEFTAPTNETPDGTVVTDDKSRIEKWGAVWNRYYQLKTNFFMSSFSQSTLSVLKDKFLWQQTLSSPNVSVSDYEKELIHDANFLKSGLKTFHAGNSQAGSVPMYRATTSLTLSESRKDDFGKLSQVKLL